MIIKNKEYINKLQQLGLTEAEARAYYHLLLNDLTAGNLSKILQLNRSYVYGLLKKLIEKGFCREIKGLVSIYQAVKPALAFELILDNYKQKITTISELSDKLTPLYHSRQPNSTPEFIKILHTKASFIDTLNKLESQAQNEVLAFSKPPFVMNLNKLMQITKLQRESLSNSVKHKTIYEIVEDNTSYLKIIKFLKNAGEDVRLAESLPLKLMIFDSKIVVFALERNLNKNVDLTFTSFDDTVLASTFRMVFQMYWDRAIPFDEYIKNK